MPNTYNDILILTADNKNQMGLSNTIKRDYGIPLDFTSVQPDYASAVTYAATSTLAYTGQIITVGEDAYIVTENSQGTFTPDEGDNLPIFLKQLGAGNINDIEASLSPIKNDILALKAEIYGQEGKGNPGDEDYVEPVKGIKEQVEDLTSYKLDAKSLRWETSDDKAILINEHVTVKDDSTTTSNVKIASDYISIASKSDNAAYEQSLTITENSICAQAGSGDTVYYTFRSQIGSEFSSSEIIATLSDISQVKNELKTELNILTCYVDNENPGDKGKSIREIAREEISAEIKSYDPEGGALIENIKTLVEYVDENAAKLGEFLEVSNDVAAKLVGIDGTVVDAIQESSDDIYEYLETNIATTDHIGGIKSSDATNKISVHEDGTAEVKTVNVNSLVQDTGDILVLDGGN